MYVFRRAAKFPSVFALTTVALILASMPVSARTESPDFAPAPCDVAAHQMVDQAPEVTRVQLGPELMVENIKGDAALTHLYNLRSRKPEVFEAASNSLRARGFTPTEHVFVQRTVRLTSDRSGSSDSDLLLVQDHSEQSANGEIVFWSWNDGDDNTWEGTVYMEVYGSEDASTWEGQIDASDDDHDWIYYQKTWDGGPGGGGPIEADREAPPFPVRAQARPMLASYSPNTAPGHDGMFMQVGWLEWAKCWRVCVVAGCIAGAIGCIASGPLWPGCFGATCSGVLVGCGIECYYDK